MEFESFFDTLLKTYNVKTITDLAEKLNLNRSTVAGWKNRETYAPILEHLLLNDLETLKSILGFNQTNNLQNSEFKSSIAVNNGGNTNINSKSDEIECDDFTKSIFKELCKIYKNDKNELNSILFKLIQNAKSN
ncbi:hypothetical protein [Aliarcobacter cryaerophilus]|uniref:hypothetical protein n=1 Tax=Aliarcobacter cryaerophilus TaxID=28198 RepID=UPI003DA48845